jgi:hypothetical protein
MTDPTAPVDVIDTAPVSMSKAELDDLLKAAAAQGAAAATAKFEAANAPAAVARWDLNTLMHSLIPPVRFTDETDIRSAHAAVDEFFPAPVDGE